MIDDAATPPPSDEHDTDHVTSTLAAAALEFPRIELPPAPNFGLPRRMDPDALDIPGLPPVMTPNVDEPEGEWKSPFPLPEPTNSYDLQIAAHADVTLPAPAASPWVADGAPVKDTASAAVMPVAPAAPAAPVRATMPAPTVVEAEPEVEATGLARPALFSFAVLAGFLFWASGYAFSAALMGFSALIAAELSAGLALAKGRAVAGDATSRIVAAASLLVALLAARKGFAGFSADAFVGGLFVIAALLPTVALLAIAHLAMRRRASLDTAADTALRRGMLFRMLIIVALAAGGYQAHAAWTARPDAMIALGITALAIATALPVLIKGAAPSRLTR